MACFLLRLPLAAIITRLSLTALWAASLSATGFSVGVPIDECVVLVNHSYCGQSLVRDDGSYLDIDGYLDYPEFSQLRVTGTITGLLCENPCGGVPNPCVVIEGVRRCDQGRNFCFADGWSGWCPCANMTPGGRGCLNSSGQGARFRTGGDPAVGSWIDIYLDGMPAGAPGVLMMGSIAAAPSPFHDGILCLGPPYRRLLSLTADAQGSLDFSLLLGTLSFALPGDTFQYQVWYGDGGGAGVQSTCGMGSNFSNAVELDWVWGPPG